MNTQKTSLSLIILVENITQYLERIMVFVMGGNTKAMGRWHRIYAAILVPMNCSWSRAANRCNDNTTKRHQ